MLRFSPTSNEKPALGKILLAADPTTTYVVCVPEILNVYRIGSLCIRSLLGQTPAFLTNQGLFFCQPKPCA